METVSSGPQKGDSTQICTGAVASEFPAGGSRCWLWLGLLKLRLKSRCVSVLPAGRDLFRVAEVWGPGARPSLMTLISEGAHALFHVAAGGPPALPPCPLLLLQGCAQARAPAGMCPAADQGFPGGGRGAKCSPPPASEHAAWAGFLQGALSAGGAGGLALCFSWGWLVPWHWGWWLTPGRGG